MTPRRSSRARTTQPPPTAMQHTNSSSSTGSLPRAERSTRSNNKNNSPQRSLTQRSQSLEDGDVAVKNDLPLTRQRQLSRNDDRNDELLQPTGDGDEDDGEEEEITRCICGQQDYPGLPLTSREADAHATAKPGVKDESALHSSANASDALSEEAGSLFIQCDACKVWQHGGCVGIMDEATTPDEYFCEECKKDLHRIVTGINGLKSSQYLPVTVSSPAASSRASSRDNKRTRDSKSRQNSNALSTKRRSTMNSRDAAYDEEEQIRRAIEESKDGNKSSTEENVPRRGKRSRSDSEANKQAAKRPRTSSPSPSSLSKQSNSVSQPDSDDETKSKGSLQGGSKKARGAAARSQKESREAEKEQEKDRPDTTSRRKGRSERRKDGNSEPSEEPSPTKAASKPAAPAQPTPEASTTPQETTNSKPATRKTGRPPARRGRLGRNQYTRDRDLANGNGADANSTNANSPRRGQSHETGTGDSPNGGKANGMNGGESGKPSKPRYMNPHRTTMNEMRRRVAAILEFISRLQVEMAVSGENTSTPAGGASASNSGNSTNSNDVEAATALVKGVEAQLGTFMQTNGEGAAPSATGASNDGSNGAAGGETFEPPKEKDFKDLTSVEMMDVLTRNLLKWQQEYGKYGEK